MRRNLLAVSVAIGLLAAVVLALAIEKGPEEYDTPTHVGPVTVPVPIAKRGEYNAFPAEDGWITFKLDAPMYHQTLHRIKGIRKADGECELRSGSGYVDKPDDDVSQEVANNVHSCETIQVSGRSKP